MLAWQGLAISIPPEDHFRQKLTELKCIGLQWAENAKKVLSVADVFLIYF